MLDKVIAQHFFLKVAVFQWWVKQLLQQLSLRRLPCKYTALHRFQVVTLI